MWIETNGGFSGSEGPGVSRRAGFVPNRMAASSSMRRFMIMMSGTSKPPPTNSATCEPSTK